MYHRTFQLQFKAAKTGIYLIGKLDSLLNQMMIFQHMDCISASNLQTQKFCRDLEFRKYKGIIKSFKILLY